MFNAPQQSLQANRNGGMATIHETKFYLVGGELPRCRRRPDAMRQFFANGIRVT
jgi:hypothetical protein